MPAKLGINGFGRIGRLVFRAAMANPEVEVRGVIVRECGVLAASVRCLMLFGKASVICRVILSASYPLICIAEVMAVNDPFMDLDYMVRSLRWIL